MRLRLTSIKSAFMFESSLMLGITKWGISNQVDIQQDYWKTWQDLKSHFDVNKE